MKLFLLVLVHSVFLVRESTSQLAYSDDCAGTNGVATDGKITIELESFGYGCTITVSDLTMTPTKLLAGLEERQKKIKLVAKSILGSVFHNFQNAINKSPREFLSESVVFERVQHLSGDLYKKDHTVASGFKLHLETVADDCYEKIEYTDAAAESTPFELPDTKTGHSTCMKYIMPSETTPPAETTTVTVNIADPEGGKTCKHGFVAFSTGTIDVPNNNMMAATIKCNADLKAATFTLSEQKTAKLVIYRKRNKMREMTAAYVVAEGEGGD